MERIKEQISFLKLLITCKKNLRNILIQSSDKEQIYSICEIILNLLRGNINISTSNYKKLIQYKKLLRKILKKSSLKKKKYLIQKGGFLEVLIPSIISVIGSLVSELI